MPGGDLAGLVLLLERQLLDNLAGDAAGGNHQPFVVLLQQRAVDPRAGKYALGHAVEVRARGQFDQVTVANLVLGQQQQVIVVLTTAHHRIFVRAGGHIGLHADDRVDFGLLGGGVELHRAIHHAVIGQRDAIHAQLGCALGDALGGGVTIQQAILRMDV